MASSRRTGAIRSSITTRFRRAPARNCSPAMARIEAKRASIMLPLLVFHGTADKLTEPDGSREFDANVGSTDQHAADGTRAAITRR